MSLWRVRATHNVSFDEGRIPQSSGSHKPRPAVNGGRFVFQNKTAACQGKLLTIKARRRLIQGAALSSKRQSGLLPHKKNHPVRRIRRIPTWDEHKI